MPDLTRHLVIQGLTRDGKVFRPSDWAERLCGMMSVFGPEQRLKYSPLVRPVTLKGVKCVVVGLELAELEPRIFNFLLHFANDNELQVLRTDGPSDAPEVANITEQLAQVLKAS